jgi:hypothetical protein
MLEAAPGIRAVAIFEEICRRNPGIAPGVPPLPGAAGSCSAVNHLPKSVVREIRTLRFVETGGGRASGDPVAAVKRRATHRNIYVRSQRAGERVMTSIERFLNKHLKLTVNKEKSAGATGAAEIPAIQHLERWDRPPKLNLIEPPWYGPVCLVVWEGRRREASPLSRSIRK